MTPRMQRIILVSFCYESDYFVTHIACTSKRLNHCAFTCWNFEASAEKEIPAATGLGGASMIRSGHVDMRYLLGRPVANHKRISCTGPDRRLQQRRNDRRVARGIRTIMLQTRFYLLWR